MLRLAFSELSPCRVIVLEENIPPALRLCLGNWLCRRVNRVAGLIAHHAIAIHGKHIRLGRRAGAPLVVALCGAQIRVELVNARGVIMLA